METNCYLNRRNFIKSVACANIALLTGCGFKEKISEVTNELTLKDSTRIWYQSKKGKENFLPFVFIHGNAQNHTSMRPLADFLNGLGHPVVVYDLAGHGASEAYKDNYYSMRRLSQTLDEILNVVHYKSPALIGHSMGGMIALQYATEHPGRIHSLMLIDTADMNPIKLNDKIPLETIVNKIIEKSYEVSETKYKGKEYEFKPNLNDDEILNFGLVNTSPFALEGNFRATRSYDVRPKLKNLRIPTIIIRGEEDILMTEKMTKDMQSRIINSKLYTINGGHNAIIQSPDSIIEIIQKEYYFLQGERI